MHKPSREYLATRKVLDLLEVKAADAELALHQAIKRYADILEQKATAAARLDMIARAEVES